MKMKMRMVLCCWSCSNQNMYVFVRSFILAFYNEALRRWFLFWCPIFGWWYICIILSKGKTCSGKCSWIIWWEWRKKKYTFDLPPTQDASEKWRFSSGSPSHPKPKNVLILVVTIASCMWWPPPHTKKKTHGSKLPFFPCNRGQTHQPNSMGWRTD